MLVAGLWTRGMSKREEGKLVATLLVVTVKKGCPVAWQGPRLPMVKDCCGVWELGSPAQPPWEREKTETLRVSAVASSRMLARARRNDILAGIIILGVNGRLVNGLGGQEGWEVCDSDGSAS